MHSQPQITLRSASGKTAKIGQLGAGLMNMTWVPEPISDEQAFEAIRTAVDGGSNMLNAGEVRLQAFHHALKLIQEAVLWQQA